MRTYTQPEVVEMLKKKQGRRNLRDFGKQLGVSQTYMHYVLSGAQEPGPKILRFLGLRREKVTTVTYFELSNGR